VGIEENSNSELSRGKTSRAARKAARAARAPRLDAQSGKSRSRSFRTFLPFSWCDAEVALERVARGGAADELI
jgi:hypothetical protein